MERSGSRGTLVRVVLTVLVLGTLSIALQPRAASACLTNPGDCPHDTVVLVIDEDSIGSGKPFGDPDGNQSDVFSAVEVNDHIAEIGLRAQLPFFADNLGQRIILRTGQIGDEGWFALTTIPAEWDAAGPFSGDGLRNYVVAGPGLGLPNANGDREALLDKVPDVTPLRATGLKMLAGQQVCAVVYDSDIGINYGPLIGSLKGANLGTVAFHVDAVNSPPRGSSSSLPNVLVTILDARTVCTEPPLLFTGAPPPTSSSAPFDVR
jgi:hypothetical protein